MRVAKIMSFEIEIITDLALLLAVASIITVIFYRLKQPLVVGYLLSGIIVGPYVFPFKLIMHTDVISAFAEIGIILLLFAIGLEFPLKKLRALGKVVLSVAALEIFFTVAASWLIGTLLHWPSFDTLFLGAALASSSTTIVAKTLTEMGKIREIPARIMLGMLVIEDVFVVLLLAALQNLAATQAVSAEGILLLLAKLAIFVTLTLGLGTLLIPRVIKRTAERTSHEVLYVAFIGLAFVFSLLANLFGFSVAIGAFLIGVVVADSHISENVSEEFTHLRHMFEAIFFVSMGTLMDIRLLGTYWLPALIIILTLMAAKFSSCALGVRLFGFDTQTSLQVALGMAQIGEFAFIVAKTGQDLGVISGFLLPVIGISAMVTSIMTPYLMRFAYKSLNI
jgi:monovalent cation:H+ antiporter-2, CPA2 family